MMLWRYGTQTCAKPVDPEQLNNFIDIAQEGGADILLAQGFQRFDHEVDMRSALSQGNRASRIVAGGLFRSS